MRVCYIYSQQWIEIIGKLSKYSEQLSRNFRMIKRLIRVNLDHYMMKLAPVAYISLGRKCIIHSGRMTFDIILNKTCQVVFIHIHLTAKLLVYRPIKIIIYTQYIFSPKFEIHCLSWPSETIDSSPPGVAYMRQ